jgi:large subunit ribosomal protein L10
MAKVESKFVIKGGYIDGKLLDKKGVEALSTLPGKDEARATFLATLLAVPQNFLRLLAAAPQNFVHLLAAREDALKNGENK